jgi:uncharacterized membrane protein
MNPVFVFLVILFAVILWFLLTFTFIPLGKLIRKILQDTKEVIEKEE